MTVGELIEELSKYDDNQDVIIVDCNLVKIVNVAGIYETRGGRVVLNTDKGDEDL
ncbi:hypothetical protein [Listeria booriae]|uniref:hypothetical protein n=1 Tax=Listeria booriae TaxID=1552123 RepID=UPI00162A074A|nr:hypothetical protein [Listeria booriae]MBC2163446.1 hypothetical protein [Listeria booriae]